jgi:hypothetical protein
MLESAGLLQIAAAFACAHLLSVGPMKILQSLQSSIVTIAHASMTYSLQPCSSTTNLLRLSSQAESGGMPCVCHQQKCRQPCAQGQADKLLLLVLLLLLLLVPWLLLPTVALCRLTAQLLPAGHIWSHGWQPSFSAGPKRTSQPSTMNCCPFIDLWVTTHGRSA